MLVNKTTTVKKMGVTLLIILAFLVLNEKKLRRETGLNKTCKNCWHTNKKQPASVTASQVLPSFAFLMAKPLQLATFQEVSLSPWRQKPPFGYRFRNWPPFGSFQIRWEENSIAHEHGWVVKETKLLATFPWNLSWFLLGIPIFHGLLANPCMPG